ncbi:MAG TPA: glycosyltransferase [Blastocatellia bacterium]|nr:glycosyltransferase [Blastocatellia bacterium]
MRKARVAVGIPTHQEADSIENVVRQVDRGLAALFDPAECVIVNVDSDSPDETSEIFLGVSTVCRKESFVINEQPRGKGRNVLRFFDRCVELNVSALAIVDGDLTSITPDWIEALLKPVLQGGADYVTPFYWRHRFDGALTNHFAYPMMRAYFGAGLRQPIGGEFAFSPSLVNYLLRQPLDEAVFGYGIDIFLSMSAVGGGFKFAQAPLGRKLHKPSLQKRYLIQSQGIAAALATARLYRIEYGAPELNDMTDSAEDLQNYLSYDEHQAMLAVARAEARKLKTIYHSWLDGKSEELFRAVEDGGAALSAEAWTDLLAACVSRAVWIEPRTPVRRFADVLWPALFIRTITYWNETWKRPIEEFNAEINHQAQLFREKLLERAHNFVP